jgi:hypothetical protein
LHFSIKGFILPLWISRFLHIIFSPAVALAAMLNIFAPAGAV